MNQTAYICVSIDMRTFTVTHVGVYSEESPSTMMHTAMSVLLQTTHRDGFHFARLDAIAAYERHYPRLAAKFPVT